MKLRRLTLVALGVVALTASAVGAGVALGSGSSHAGNVPRDEQPAGSVTAAPSRSASGVKCKSQACVHFLSDGTISGHTKKVDSVNHVSTGLYCVVLQHSLHVNDDTAANLTIDYLNSGSNPGIVVESDSTDCGVDGFSNAIRVRTFNLAGTLTDYAVWLNVP